MPYSFRNLRLGYAAAEEERASDPDLLLYGFLDPFGAMGDLRDGRKFLVLGPKGSGKSAIGQRLALEAGADPMLFVEATNLSDFPFDTFSKLGPGDDEAETKLNRAWRWVLLLQIFGTLSKDQGARHGDADAWEAVRRLLTERGLLSAPDMRAAVTRSVGSALSFEATLPFLPVKVAWTSGAPAVPADLAVNELVDALVASAKTDSKHFVVVDGLDDLLTDGNLHLQTIASLVTQAYRLNLHFEDCGVPVKIIVLCRTDLFDRLPDANTTKMRRDRAVELDWYGNPRNFEESMLLRVVALRAKLSFGIDVDIFHEFFPERVEGGDPRTWLLELTRHTPRDFLQLLGFIKEHWGGGKLSRDQILLGTRKYSYEYFLPEIRDHLHGFVTNETERAMMDLLGSLGMKTFTKSDFMRHAGRQGVVLKGGDVNMFLRAMFEAGALGNIKSTGPEHSVHHTWHFRNRHSMLDLAGEFMLHRGSWKAFSLI